MTGNKFTYTCKGCNKILITNKYYPDNIWACPKCREIVKVPVTCEDCGKVYEITFKSYRQSRSHICKSCSGKRNTEALREGNKKYFDDPKNVESHSKLCKQIWDDRPEEFKSKRKKDLKVVGDAYRASVDFPSIISNRTKEYFKNPKNRQHLSEIQLVHWASLTLEERELKMLHLVEYWDNISDENLDNSYKNRLDSIIESDKIIKGPTEIIFCEDLDKIPLLTKKVNYKWQYRNQIKHPDFNKMFPINPVTNSKRISPYHIWDFIIYSEDGNILVDIDGKIHNIEHGKVNYCGKNIDLLDLIKFNDSQRPYQTDDFDAYIVKAYNNKLEDNTEVLVLKDNSIITYKKLLSIIMTSQISKSEFKELRKCI